MKQRYLTKSRFKLAQECPAAGNCVILSTPLQMQKKITLNSGQASAA